MTASGWKVIALLRDRYHFNQPMNRTRRTSSKTMDGMRTQGRMISRGAELESDCTIAVGEDIGKFM